MQNAVSALIPAYNGAQYIAETLDSILTQSYPVAEVIVVDDGSTDNTREVVASFGDHVRYHSTSNGGVCRARNIAASLASSPYLTFSDQDDLWRTDKLEQQMSLHEKFPGMDYSFTNFVLVQDGIWAEKTEFDHAPDRSFPPYSLPGTEPVVIDTPFYNQILAFQPIRPSTVLISTRLFQQIGCFTESLGKNPSEDVEFTLRCLQHPPIGIVREPVVGIRKHTGNYSGSDYRNMLGQKEIFEYALQHHTIDEQTRTMLLHEIELRRLGAAYYAFRQGEFNEVVSLLQPIHPAKLDAKLRMKLLISRLPVPLARTAQKLLLQ